MSCRGVKVEEKTAKCERAKEARECKKPTCGLDQPSHGIGVLGSSLGSSGALLGCSGAPLGAFGGLLGVIGEIQSASDAEKVRKSDKSEIIKIP